jgi:serine-type D-Ala-D-Ala endopeptidase (penicillin-binding protein 7)
VVLLTLGVAPAAEPAARKATAAKATPTRSVSTKKTPARATVGSKSRTSSAARRRAIARSRSAARATEARELAKPRFKVDGTGHEVPAPRAAAAIIYDPETNQVLFEENAEQLRSIASITKVMTALVFLESLPDLSQSVTVERSDVIRASTTYLRAGNTVTGDDLLHLLLIGSDNAAARVIARVSAFGTEGFIGRMNEKAAELGLEMTHYEDTSGLMSANVSSAFDMARLIAYAAADERIGAIMRKSGYTMSAGRRKLQVNSTNRLVRTGELEILGGKTGFISSSGYCLATLVRLPQTGRQVAVVVLGARSNAGRFAETKHLYNWLSAHMTTVTAADAAQNQQQ